MSGWKNLVNAMFKLISTAVSFSVLTIYTLHDMPRKWRFYLQETKNKYNISNYLRNWINARGQSMLFAVFVVWKEPKNHTSDC